MNMKEVQNMARRIGVKPRGKTKAVLIREIQRAEGHFDCFGSAVDYCDQLSCAFYADCLRTNALHSVKQSR
ncbi:hypothetical protein [Desulfoferrobacter suflitae]|uniref:hypothetical protein n=1 Tax=Desulfoferrobacter suflitae TaxID=2865782 RepID=UPI002164CAAF|nr:hypothetical protein [Desulfoferrobacter suflitae]MCK8602924.1 hypothetical protein [Desulfoferrobacter suflitae]